MVQKSLNAKASILRMKGHGIQAFAFSFSFCQGSSNGASVEKATFYLKAHREGGGSVSGGGGGAHRPGSPPG